MQIRAVEKNKKDCQTNNGCDEVQHNNYIEYSTCTVCNINATWRVITHKIETYNKC